VPLVGNVPLQPPEAVQDVALVELQVSMEVPPLGTLVGFAIKVAAGTELAVTLTVVAAAVLVPSEPVQVSEYVMSVVKAPVLSVPLVAFAPANVPPVAVQDVVPVELQVNVALPPLLTVVGEAVIDAVGGADAVVTGTPDPPQAARSSVAPIAIAGAQQRTRGFSKFCIMFGRCAASSVIPATESISP
jgi:hypothetical protein